MWKVPPAGRERISARTTVSVSVHQLAHAGRGGALRAMHGQEGLHHRHGDLGGSKRTTAPLRRMIW
jgi:hypothetical protein